MGLNHAWLDELDVVGPRWRTSVWGWALLVLGMAMALHAWQHQQQASIDLQAAEDEVARLMRAQQRLAAADASPRQGLVPVQTPPRRAWMRRVGVVPHSWRPGRRWTGRRNWITAPSWPPSSALS